MPITLPPISRRRFLATSIAGVTALTLGERCVGGASAGQRDPNRVVLLSDIHVPTSPKAEERGVNMTQHMREAVAQVLELEKSQPRPSAAIISGDCAYHTGEAGDYQALLGVLSPLTESGLPIHLVMGNHDQRERFWSVLPHDKLTFGPARREMQNRHVLVLRSPKVNWVILDSLDKVNASPGLLGAEQIQWLKGMLDLPEHSQKPVIIVVHHDPVAEPPPKTGPASTKPAKAPGLVDAPALLDVVLPRKQVKAIVFGHTHVWSIRQLQGLHLVNIPAIAYVFDAKQPSAWADCRISESGMRLELHCLDPRHPKQGDVAEIQWRT